MSALPSPDRTAPTPEALPHVTVGMVVDALSDCDIVVRPNPTRRIMRWFDSPDRCVGRWGDNLRSGQVLRVSDLDDARNALESDEHLFVCALSPDGEAPAWAREYPDRLLVVRRAGSLDGLLLRVQSLFADMTVWEARMDRIVLEGGSLQELAEAAAEMIPGTISCTDTAGTPLATAGSAGGRVGAERVVKVNGFPFAALSLSVSGAAPTEGQTDLFAIFARKAQDACEAAWKAGVLAENPHYSLFAGLIEKTIDAADALSRTDAIGIPRRAEFKLVLFDAAGTDPSTLRLAAKAAGRFNHGSCCAFAYRGDICIVCFAPAGDNVLSNEKTSSDAQRLLSGPYGMLGSSSQIFECIADLDLAYRQAIIAKRLRPIVEREADGDFAGLDAGARDVEPRPDGAEGRSAPRPAIIPFENCIMYYLIASHDKDERFVRFASEHLLVQKIRQEDLAKGTNHLEVLWNYLMQECNASAVADRLHMHRNTVLYQIRKIENRFDLDLSSPLVRQKTIVDFKMLFLMQNRRTFEGLFD